MGKDMEGVVKCINCKKDFIPWFYACDICMNCYDKRNLNKLFINDS